MNNPTFDPKDFGITKSTWVKIRILFEEHALTSSELAEMHHLDKDHLSAALLAYTKTKVKQVHDPVFWNEKRLSTLITLWNDGSSISEIGKELGVSRNAVAGKVHRLKLPKRDREENTERIRKELEDARLEDGGKVEFKAKRKTVRRTNSSAQIFNDAWRELVDDNRVAGNYTTWVNFSTLLSVKMFESDNAAAKKQRKENGELPHKAMWLINDKGQKANISTRSIYRAAQKIGKGFTEEEAHAAFDTIYNKAYKLIDQRVVVELELFSNQPRSFIDVNVATGILTQAPIYHPLAGTEKALNAVKHPSPDVIVTVPVGDKPEQQEIVDFAKQIKKVAETRLMLEKQRREINKTYDDLAENFEKITKAYEADKSEKENELTAHKRLLQSAQNMIAKTTRQLEQISDVYEDEKSQMASAYDAKHQRLTEIEEEARELDDIERKWLEMQAAANAASAGMAISMEIGHKISKARQLADSVNRPKEKAPAPEPINDDVKDAEIRALRAEKELSELKAQNAMSELRRRDIEDALRRRAEASAKTSESLSAQLIYFEDQLDGKSAKTRKRTIAALAKWDDLLGTKRLIKCNGKKVEGDFAQRLGVKSGLGNISVRLDRPYYPKRKDDEDIENRETNAYYATFDELGVTGVVAIGLADNSDKELFFMSIMSEVEDWEKYERKVVSKEDMRKILPVETRLEFHHQIKMKITEANPEG